MQSELSILNFQNELFQNILPFWMKNAPDRDNGGFYGGITNELAIRNDVPRTAVSCARFLWTFSHAFLVTRDQQYMDIAHHAYDYLMKAFWDERHGGLFWSVDYLGRAIAAHKHSYAQAFGIYGLSEYYKATGLAESLGLANELFTLLETNAHDRQHGGYLEGCAQDWTALLDMRLGAHDLNCQKSMNTMLHIMEAFTNFVSISKDQLAKERLKETIQIFQNRIISPQNHFLLFFDTDWEPLSDHMSFGHDIEGSWLLAEAAEALGDPSLTESVSAGALALASGVLKDGIGSDHHIIHEASPLEITNRAIEWWPQAEAVVGFFNAYQMTGDHIFLSTSSDSWAYINDHLVDRVFGGWIKRLLPDGTIDETSLKAGPWEGPYHESRMCFEMIQRLATQTKSPIRREDE